MTSTKGRMIIIATLVCGFAVGMSAFLTYCKFRSTMHAIITDRVNATGRSVQNTIMGSLQVGLQFSELETLHGTLQRERATDDVITGIDVFDTEGKILYTTESEHAPAQVATAWLRAAGNSAANGTWFVDGDRESATGMTVDNAFGLKVGYIALRYSNERVEQGMRDAARQIAVAALGVFLVAATLASLGLLAVMRRLGRDVQTLESKFSSVEQARASATRGDPHFGLALQRFVETIHTAEAEIATVRTTLRSGPV